MKKRASSWMWVLGVVAVLIGSTTDRVAAADEDQGFTAEKYVGNNGKNCSIVSTCRPSSTPTPGRIPC